MKTLKITNLTEDEVTLLTNEINIYAHTAHRDDSSPLAKLTRPSGLKFNPPLVQSVETNVIKLYSSNNYYTQLRNDYEFALNITDLPHITYKSVSNYIYSNYNDICPRSAKEIEDIAPNLAHNKAIELYESCVIEKKGEAIKIAYIKKFKNNSELIDILLKTGKSNILYTGTIGVEECLNTNGQNIVGLILQKLRSRYVKQKESDDKEKLYNKIYNIYAYKFMLDNWAKNNLLDNYTELDSYERLDSDTNKRFKLGDEYLHLSTTDFLIEYNNSLLKKYTTYNYIQEEIDNKGILFRQIKKDNIEQFEKNVINKRIEIVFNMYLDYILSKKFISVTEDKYTEAKNIHFIGDQTNLKARVFKLFEIGMLSSTLSDKIDKKLSEHPIPTKDYKKILIKEYDDFIKPIVRSLVA